jgi:hypothetical protein
MEVVCFVAEARGTPRKIINQRRGINASERIPMRRGRPWRSFNRQPENVSSSHFKYRNEAKDLPEKSFFIRTAGGFFAHPGNRDLLRMTVDVLSSPKSGPSLIIKIQ